MKDFTAATPDIHPSVFVAPGVQVMGQVQVGADSSLWYNAVIRGDVHHIRIGEMTNIQDGCILHVTVDAFSLTVGSRVTVGHGAILHGCIVEDDCLIGMGATVLDGAIVQSWSMVAAGSLVPPGMEVPTGYIVAGVPAKPLRELRKDERDYIKSSAPHYRDLAARHRNLR